MTPDFGLVTPERIGDVIAPANLKIGRGSMTVRVATPEAPGRYRLTVTLHDEDGVAYDPVTQAQVPSLIFRVTGDLDAGFDAPAALALTPGAAVDLQVPVANLGRQAWGHVAFDDPRDPEGNIKARSRPDDRDVGRPRSAGGPGARRRSERRFSDRRRAAGRLQARRGRQAQPPTVRPERPR